MASFSAYITAPTGIIFLAPKNPAKRVKITHYRTYSPDTRSRIRVFGSKVRAVQREESTVLDERDRELADKLNGSVNGNGSVNHDNGNGSAGYYANGSVEVESDNGNLVKYADGNGNGSVATEVSVGAVKVEEVISRKKTIEEIGQEEVWFKQKGQDRVGVC